jgi:pSer/pThr/pTyr-binding forkhead associated (FHA) protein
VILLKILSGQQAGVSWSARHFPVRIGRSTGCDLCLEEPGVWDQHVALTLDSSGFFLRTQGAALARVNGQPVAESVLRNGDAIEIGTVKLQFWLSSPQQKRLRLRELLSWGTILLVCLGQVIILYLLFR